MVDLGIITIGLFLMIVPNWFIFAYDKKDFNYGKHLGQIISKEEYMSYLGKGIKLEIKFKDKVVKFEDAEWVLRKFTIGDNIQWTKVFWIKDPRGTNNLKKY